MPVCKYFNQMCWIREYSTVFSLLFDFFSFCHASGVWGGCLFIRWITIKFKSPIHFQDQIPPKNVIFPSSLVYFIVCDYWFENQNNIYILRNVVGFFFDADETVRWVHTKTVSCLSSSYFCASVHFFLLCGQAEL